MRCLTILLVMACACVASTQTNIHMLVPGFRVEELPLRLSNVNNLRFAPDGRLFALGYNGRVHVLRDTDGDGLEDAAEVFWDKPTITVPVGMFIAADGVLIASQGKISLLSDTNGDGRADVERILASGWPATDVHSGGVDAAAITADADGNIYFGLLTADYSNPYRVKDGVARYDVRGRRGTIQKLARDGTTETFATGIRVPYTLAFNRRGDLFVTDQEGETWCPGGNPLDELNHVMRGRNYGFPPRHPQYLPDLVSEPPVVGFGPQHQSTCGLVFNEPAGAQGLFGPWWWEGDAFVAGQSRGKIWRVRLVKTPQGYMGKEHLIASLNMLTPDLAISPGGALYVACHSGPPDWGTGPNGRGRLFKISYADANAPQPVAAGTVDPETLWIHFDRELDDAATNAWVGRSIVHGEFVRAADRFEVLRPPYKVLKQQLESPQGKLAIHGARLSPDRRSLVLATGRQDDDVTYATTLSGITAAGSQAATVDMAFTRHGVSAAWIPDDGRMPEGLWLPHLDLDASCEWLRGTTVSNTIARSTGEKRTSRLQLTTYIRFPAGEHRLHLDSDTRFTVRAGFNQPSFRADTNSFTRVELKAGETDRPWGVQVTFVDAPARAMPSLHAYYTSGDDVTPRVIPPDWLKVSDVMRRPATVPAAPAESFLARGDYENGRALFFGERLKCATCHRIRGEGMGVGPDLSHLVSRDMASVRRDIQEPDASINPDHVAFNITLHNGDEWNGIARMEGTNVRVVTGDGKATVIPRSQVKEMQASSVSLMPTGLLEGLKENQVDDLLHFLLNAPPGRSTAEARPLAGRATMPTNAAPLRVVLVASKQDHGPQQHDYPAWQTNWHRWLSRSPALAVTNAWLWPAEEQFESADVIVFYYWNRDWSTKRFAELDRFLGRGGGVVLLHSACISDNDPEALAMRLGMAAQPRRTKYRHAALDLNIAGEHPITRGLTRVRFLDETYWPLIGDTNRVTVLATAEEDGTQWPMFWTFEPGAGRVFGSILGHYTWTLDDPLFRLVILRAIAWAAKEPVTRLESLALQEASPETPGRR